jgi:Lipase (class 3)
MSQYTYPPAFDVNRAKELGDRINDAYAQFDAFQSGGTWTAPEGYAIKGQFFAHEPGRGGLLEGVQHLLKDPLNELKNIAGLVHPGQVPFGYVAVKGSDVFVVIRGTRTSLEWMDDFTSEPVPFSQGWGRTTQGFKTIYIDIIKTIIEALQPLVADGTPRNYYVTGHSLGAALAHLVSAAMNIQLKIKATTYTMSGPRAGDTTFVQAHDDAGLITWRIFNTEDIVPTVPPAAVNVGAMNLGPLAWLLKALVGKGFEHTGYPIAVTFHYDSLSDNHSLTNLCKVL